MKNIKVLTICASPRDGKNTQQLIDQTILGCESMGATVENYTINGKKFNPCLGCSSCRKGKGCPINDDITILFEKMKEADVIFFGSPVFFYNVTAQCKMIMDRSYAIQPLNGNKVGGILLVAGSVGCSSALSSLDLFFDGQGITSAGFVMSLGRTYENEKAMKAAYDLGIKSVKMAKVLKESDEPFTAHTHFAYGTHTK